jgi:hypothetical protein
LLRRNFQAYKTGKEKGTRVHGQPTRTEDWWTVKIYHGCGQYLRDPKKEKPNEVLLSAAGKDKVWFFFDGAAAPTQQGRHERWPCGCNVEILWDDDDCWNRAQVPLHTASLVVI